VTSTTTLDRGSDIKPCVYTRDFPCTHIYQKGRQRGKQSQHGNATRQRQYIASVYVKVEKGCTFHVYNNMSIK